MNKQHSIQTYFQKEIVAEILKSNSHYRILLVYGAIGTGRTMLLNAIRRQLIEKHIVYVDMSKVNNYDELQENILPEFNLEVSKKVVLLIDNLECLLSIEDGECFFRFEREVLLPITKNDRVDVIATSSLDIRSWREYEVRNCLHSVSIPSLDNDALNTWATQIGISNEKAIKVTLGYPLLMAWLEEEPDLEEAELYDRFVDRYLQDMTIGEREFILMVSLFPVFNIDLLEKVFERVFKQETWTYGDFVEKLRPMMAMGLIIWHSGVGAYTFQDNRVRRFFAETLRFQNPEGYRKAHEEAKEIFKQETRYVSYLDYSLPSFIYHASITTGLKSRKNWQVGEDDEKIGAEAVAWLRNQLPDWRGADWKKLYKVWIREEGDQEFVKELKELISVDAFNTICKLFDEAV